MKRAECKTPDGLLDTAQLELLDRHIRDVSIL
jgi:hypothetical protein